MKDSEARGIVLKRLYDIRHDIDTAYPQNFKNLDIPENVISNILSQLSDKGVIWFDPHRSSSSGLIDTFKTRILALGVDVIEGTKEPPFAIVFPVSVDSSVTVQGSQNVMVGGQGNIQNLTMNVERMNSIIDSSDASITDKEEAKSLLKQLSESKLAQWALGKLIGGRVGQHLCRRVSLLAERFLLRTLSYCRLGCLVVLLPEQMRVDLQRDVRRTVS